jgi:hypothetical protein
MRPLDLYVGDLDLVNGLRLARSTINSLKLHALVYDQLAVYDGFTWCYGPLTSHFHMLLQTPSRYQFDEVYQLLQHGILVPITRAAATLLTIYRDNPAVRPGENLCLRAEDRDVVELISDACREHRIVRELPSINERWAKVILDHALRDDSPASLRAAGHIAASGFDATLRRDALHRLEDFCGKLKEMTTSSTFARRDVEEAVREVFGIADFEPSFDATVYSKAMEGVAEHRRAGDPRQLVAHRLLTLLSTSYQAVHSGELNAYGSLFRAHDRDTAVAVCARAGADAFDAFGSLVQPQNIEIAPRLDVSRLTIDDIRELRERTESTTYRMALREWLSVASNPTDVIDSREIEDRTKNLVNKHSAYYRVILEKCGTTDRRLWTDVAVIAVPILAAGVSGLVALMGGDIVAVVPFFSIGAAGAAKFVDTLLKSGGRDLAVRRIARRQLRNYATRQGKYTA